MNTALALLEGWYLSWAVRGESEGMGIGGPTATLWGSTARACLPHLLNHAAVIRGLCLRAGDPGGDRAIARAEPLVRFILGCQDPDSGLFTAGWGDVPYCNTGLIHQALTTTALWEYYSVTRDEQVKKTAQKAWQAIIASPYLSWTVVNQVLRATETLIARLKAVGQEPTVGEKQFLQRWGKWALSLQLKRKDAFGAFPQGLADDNIWSFYQGKLIHPPHSFGADPGRRPLPASSTGPGIIRGNSGDTILIF